MEEYIGMYVGLCTVPCTFLKNVLKTAYKEVTTFYGLLPKNCTVFHIDCNL